MKLKTISTLGKMYRFSFEYVFNRTLEMYVLCVGVLVNKKLEAFKLNPFMTCIQLMERWFKHSFDYFLAKIFPIKSYSSSPLYFYCVCVSNGTQISQKRLIMRKQRERDMPNSYFSFTVENCGDFHFELQMLCYQHANSPKYLPAAYFFSSKLDLLMALEGKAQCKAQTHRCAKAPTKKLPNVQKWFFFSFHFIYL